MKITKTTTIPAVTKTLNTELSSFCTDSTGENGAFRISTGTGRSAAGWLVPAGGGAGVSSSENFCTVPEIRFTTPPPEVRMRSTF